MPYAELPSAPSSAATPTDVDTFLAVIYRESAAANRDHDAAERSQKRIHKNAAGRDPLPIEQGQLDRLQDRMAAASDRLRALSDLARPAEQRYAAEQWTRAFLVNNTNGHVHSSMQCPTCFPTTEYFWLPELSGSAEADIVEKAGERACTVCYPSAPAETLSRPTQLFTDDEKEAQQRRAERAAKKVAADAKKLYDPRTGELLRGEYSAFKTERGAELSALDGLKSLAWYGTHPSAQAWLDLANLVAYAKAAKHNTDPAAEFDTLKTKAGKSARREGAQSLTAIEDLSYTAPEGA